MAFQKFSTSFGGGPKMSNVFQERSRGFKRFDGYYRDVTGVLQSIPEVFRIFQGNRERFKKILREFL